MKAIFYAPARNNTMKWCCQVERAKNNNEGFNKHDHNTQREVAVIKTAAGQGSRKKKE